MVGAAYCRPTPPPPPEETPGVTVVTRQSPATVSAGLRAASYPLLAVRSGPYCRLVVFHTRASRNCQHSLKRLDIAICLPTSQDPFKRDTTYPRTWAIEGTYLVFSQQKYDMCLPLHPVPHAFLDDFPCTQNPPWVL